MPKSPVSLEDRISKKERAWSSRRERECGALYTRLRSLEFVAEAPSFSNKCMSVRPLELARAYRKTQINGAHFSGI